MKNERGDFLSRALGKSVLNHVVRRQLLEKIEGGTSMLLRCAFLSRPRFFSLWFPSDTISEEMRKLAAA